MNIPILAYAAAISTLVPFAVGLFRLRALQPEFRWLVAVFGFHALVTAVQYILASRGINNLWTSQVFNIVEVVIFLVVFSLWTDSALMERLLKALAFLYGIFWMFLKLFVERFDTYSSYSSPISRIVLIIAVTYILFFVARSVERPVLRDPRFWIGFGLLVACSGSLMFYALRNFIANLPMETVFKAFSIHWVVVIVSNSFFTIGLLCKPLSLSSGGQLELAR